MYSSIFIYAFFLISFLFEIFIYPIPLTIIASVLLYLFADSIESLGTILIAALMLDAIRLHTLGISALYIFAILLIIVLYQTKFEIKSASFVTFILSLGVIIYSFFSGYEFTFWIYVFVPFFLYFLTSLLFPSKKDVLYE